MAMRTASPWWASLVFGAGLLLILVGERLFGDFAGPHYGMTIFGLVLVLGITGLRAYTTASSTGARRKVERALLWCQLGALLALVVYAFTTKWGMDHFHFTDKGAAKFTTVLTVVWTILVMVSLIPMLMIELSLGIALRTAIDLKSAGDEGVEYMRVRDVGWSGLSIALAAAFLMVTCNVASERNIQRDVSYFKTSSPGASTRNIVQSSEEPIKVMMFFTSPNEVEDQVRYYFEALASATGKISVEHRDRMGDPELAAKYKVSKDGTIVLVRGTGDKEKNATIDVDTDIMKARRATKLRNFDREVNTQLMKLIREKRKAYVTAGHGEITDPESVPPEMKGRVPERHTTAFKKRLADLGYEVKDLGLMDLSKDVPADATVVVMLGPSVALQPAEVASIGRYLDKGGRIMIALDPKGEPSMGGLESRFGLKMAPGDLTDEQAFLPQRMQPSDRRFVITTGFSPHASTTALSRSAKGLVLIDSGAFDEVPMDKDTKKTITIRSMDKSFMDLNDNFSFDKDSEKQQRWTIAAAVEGPKLKDKDGKDKDGWRALLYADADLFADARIQDALGRAALVMVSEVGGGGVVDDAIRWLGGEEVFSGEVVSEDDKPIQHSKKEDAVWFTLTIIGGPLVVLTVGLVGVWARRRRTRKPVEVKP